MFPLRDENPHFLTPYATWGLIGLNVQPRADSRRGAADGVSRHPGAVGAGHHLRAGRHLNLVHGRHLHVPALWLVPPDRQYVVPLHLRQQRRGLHGPHPLRDLLPAVRPRGGGLADRIRPGLHHPHGGRFRRHRRRHGCLHPAVSEGAGAHADRVRLLHHHHRRTGHVHAGLLVPDPAHQRLQHHRLAGRGRRLLGARGRLRRRRAARPGVPRPPPGGPPSEPRLATPRLTHRPGGKAPPAPPPRTTQGIEREYPRHHLCVPEATIIPVTQ